MGIFSTLCTSKVFKKWYLHLATFLSTRGITPPFSPSLRGGQRRWAEQGNDGNLTKPEIYVQEDASLQELFRDVVPLLPPDARILELGCNVGRSLNYLYRHGYRNLTGIEIGAKAVELMKTTFPDVYASAKIIVGDMPQEIRKLATADYDLVFCHSVLVNIHPSCNDVFKEIARVSRRFVLTLENEGSITAYPRDFKKVFEKQKYKMIVSKLFRAACESLAVPYRHDDLYSNNTIRLFVRDESR